MIEPSIKEVSSERGCHPELTDATFLPDSLSRSLPRLPVTRSSVTGLMDTRSPAASLPPSSQALAHLADCAGEDRHQQSHAYHDGCDDEPVDERRRGTQGVADEAVAATASLVAGAVHLTNHELAIEGQRFRRNGAGPLDRRVVDGCASRVRDDERLFRRITLTRLRSS